MRAKSAVLTDEMVLSGSIGRTRPVKNVFQLWKQIFVSNNTKKPGAKKPAGGGGAAGGPGGRRREPAGDGEDAAAVRVAVSQ